MLTREQRMKSVPGLIELGDDPSLDATTHSWVHQALRETNVNLPNDPAAWRNWYSTHRADKAHEFGTGDSWSVLGNSWPQQRDLYQGMLFTVRVSGASKTLNRTIPTIQSSCAEPIRCIRPTGRYGHFVDPARSCLNNKLGAIFSVIPRAASNRSH